MAVPFVIAGNDVNVTASIGIAPYAADTPAPGVLMIKRIVRSTGRRRMAKIAIARIAVNWINKFDRGRR